MVEAAVGTPVDVIPSVRRLADLSITISTEVEPGAVEAVAFLVATDGPIPTELGADRATLGACGFHGKAGQAFVVPDGDQTVRVAVGAGEAGSVSANALRDAAATFSRAFPHLSRFAT